MIVEVNSKAEIPSAELAKHDLRNRIQAPCPQRLEGLPESAQRRVIAKIEALRNDLAGDVKKLTNFTPEYRLRVGDNRVLFEVVGNRIIVYRIIHRKDAYR
jgi:mRNA interferase RelE/StbE